MCKHQKHTHAHPPSLSLSHTHTHRGRFLACTNQVYSENSAQVQRDSGHTLTPGSQAAELHVSLRKRFSSCHPDFVCVELMRREWKTKLSKNTRQPSKDMTLQWDSRSRSSRRRQRRRPKSNHPKSDSDVTTSSVSDDITPPMPPMREQASLESPVSPDTNFFSRLHEMYSRQVKKLRAVAAEKKQWQK